jgi:hypothetical protein
MKKHVTILVFLAVWFFASNFMLDISWWKPYLHRIIVLLISTMAGMSVGATVAILTLSLIDRVLGKVQALGSDANASMVPSVKN